MSTNDWPGILGDFEHLGRPDQPSHQYKEESYEHCTTALESYHHAAHALIYADDDSIKFKFYPARAAIMMQMRCDGYVGFPGGMVDDGENIEAAVNRELREEIGLNLKKYEITKEDHFMSQVSEFKKLCLHFYVKKVTLEEFFEIEMDCLRAPDHGTEVMGALRVPLYTMGDGMRGLPVFLANQFIGNARQQLITALLKLGIMTEDEVIKVLKGTEMFKSSL
ncbi:unnamed protein product [Owenia fusiformis]|uniref:U8 snoRNA-decapping enzyme n=1 Tax=Owenia fusiformis TaxID=6347 RepID=A0A8S4NPQ5_OWEFU|nr:unnamed protein product [Owenia fusiformis]